MSLDELRAAMEEAREAAEIADEKSKVVNDLRWDMAQAAAGEAGEDPSINGLFAILAELDKLPRDNFQPCAFYDKDGDFLEVHWRNCPTLTHWVNHVVSLKKCYGGHDGEEAEHAECKDTVVGIQVYWAKLILARSNTLITPDLPNPSRAVEEAKEKGVCRICRRELAVGTAPAAVKERFGSQNYGDSIVFNLGEEYAHQACLNMEKKGVNEGIN
jgi:hypothetical protein